MKCNKIKTNLSLKKRNTKFEVTLPLQKQHDRFTTVSVSPFLKDVFQGYRVGTDPDPFEVLDEKFGTEFVSTLVIPSVQQQDFGTYEVRTRNIQGYAQNMRHCTAFGVLKDVKEVINIRDKL